MGRDAMIRDIFRLWAMRPNRLLWMGFAVFLLLSCGMHEQGEVASSRGTGSVTFTAKWVPLKTSPDMLAIEAPSAQPLAATDVCIAYGLNQVHLEVWRDGTTPTSTGVSATQVCTAHTATLGGVPTNVEDLYVVLTTVPEGWYGESIRFTLGSGETEDLGTMTVGLPPIAPPWHSPVIVNAGSGEVTDLEIAMDGSGNAFLIWSQANAEIWAKRYSPTGGWSTAALLDGSGDVGEPRIAVIGSRTAIAVWTRGTLITEPLEVPSVYVNHFTPLGGWNIAAMLASSSRYPQIAMSSSGAAFAVWQGLSPNCSTSPCIVSAGVYTGRYTPPPGGWVLTGSLGGLINGEPRIAMADSGKAVVVRCSQSGIVPPVTYSIQANSYTSTDGWSNPTLLDSGGACYPDLAMDSAGNAVAVWIKGFGDIHGTWSTPSDGWGSVTLLDGLSGTVGLPDVAMDTSGTATAVWEQISGGNNNIYAIRYTPAGGWGSTTLLELNAGNTESPDIAMDGSGNALAVWRQEDATNNSIYANGYTVSSAWSGATLIEHESGVADLPRIAMDESGTGIAVWKIGGTIYANHYY
jgi:hypothetical protein